MGGVDFCLHFHHRYYVLQCFDEFSKQMCSYFVPTDRGQACPDDEVKKENPTAETAIAVVIVGVAARDKSSNSLLANR